MLNGTSVNTLGSRQDTWGIPFMCFHNNGRESPKLQTETATIQTNWFPKIKTTRTGNTFVRILPVLNSLCGYNQWQRGLTATISVTPIIYWKWHVDIMHFYAYYSRRWKCLSHYIESRWHSNNTISLTFFIIVFGCNLNPPRHCLLYGGLVSQLWAVFEKLIIRFHNSSSPSKMRYRNTHWIALSINGI